MAYREPWKPTEPLDSEPLPSLPTPWWGGMRTPAPRSKHFDTMALAALAAVTVAVIVAKDGWRAGLFVSAALAVPFAMGWALLELLARRQRTVRTRTREVVEDDVSSRSPEPGPRSTGRPGPGAR